MTALQERIRDDMKQAMRAGNKQRVDALRLILAAIKQYEIDNREKAATLSIEENDNQLASILQKMLKQRKESIKQYESANRHDLAEQEAFEMNIIQTYLPPPLSLSEIDALIQTAIQLTKAHSVGDLSKVMAELKPLLHGKADMAVVISRIKHFLNLDSSLH